MAKNEKPANVRRGVVSVVYGNVTSRERLSCGRTSRETCTVGFSETVKMSTGEHKTNR